MKIDSASLPAHIRAAMERAPAIRSPLHDHTNDHNPRPQVQNPEPERHETPALGGSIQGEAKGDGRIVVSFVGYRVRPLDPDNFAGGCKDLIDGLRHAGLIPGDEAWRIRLETEQVKVAHFKEERTEIVITKP